MAGPLHSSTWLAHTLPSDISELLLTKIHIPSWLPQTQACSPPGPRSLIPTCWQSLCLSILHFSVLDLLLPRHGSFFLLLCPCLGILKISPLSLCLATRHRQLFTNQNQLEVGGRDHQCLTWRCADSCVSFWEPN